MTKWKATADSLVTDDVCAKIFEAESEEEAWAKAEKWLWSNDYLDKGSLDMHIHREDKTEICNRLYELLKYTRAGNDIADLTYSSDAATCEEYVTVLFTSGYSKTINVSCDSGVALILDVVKRII